MKKLFSLTGKETFRPLVGCQSFSPISGCKSLPSAPIKAAREKRETWWILLLVVLPFFIASPSWGQTSYRAYDIPSGTVGNHATVGLEVGDDFQVINPITISQLGVFNSGANGIQGGATLTVQLYERSGRHNGTLLATMAFNATDPGKLIGGTLFKPLDRPITLLPGNYTIAAFGFDTNNPECNAGLAPFKDNPPPWADNTGNGLIRFEGWGRFVRQVSSGGTYPAHLDQGPADRYAAGNFIFSAATLPSPPYAADYAALTAGVTSFSIDDQKHIGSIAVLDLPAFPVFVERGGNRLILEAAGSYNGDTNGGRAVAFSHFQWEQAGDSRGRLFEDAIQWVSRKSNPANIVVGVSTNLSLYFMHHLDPGYLESRGYQVVPIDFETMDPAAGLPPMDVLVLDGHARYDPGWIPAIQNFCANGGGLVMSLTPRFAAYPNIVPAFNYANQILQPYNLAYRPNITGPVDFTLTNVQTVPYPVEFDAFPAAELLHEDRMGQIQLDGQQKAIALNTISYAIDGQPQLLSQLTAVYEGTTNTAPYTGPSGNFVDVVTMNGSQATNILGAWAVDGTSLVAQGPRGIVQFPFTLPASDMYQLQIYGAEASTMGLSARNFNLELTVDGQSLGHINLAATNSWGGVAECLLPFLTAGPHTLSILWDNAASYTSLQLESVRIQAGLGEDTTGSGIKDWVEQVLHEESGLDNTNQTIGSYVSPVNLEGRDPYPNFMSIFVEGADNGTPSLNPIPGPNGRWTVNVPLSAYVNADTILDVSYQNGALTETRHLQWLPINLLSANDVMIRQGDSLLFNAIPAGVTSNANLLIGIGTNQLSGKTFQPIVYQFNTPGTYTVSGTYNPSNGVPQSGEITVNVAGKTMTNNPDAWAGWERDWEIPFLPPGVVPDVDSRVFYEIWPLSDVEEDFELIADANEPRYLFSHLDTNGPVLDTATINGFNLWSADTTYARVVQTYPDGSELVQVLVILSPVLPDLTVQLNTLAAGITFDDGTTSKTLTPADFDALGQCVVYFIRAASATTSVCHSLSVYQGTNLIEYTR